MHDILFNIHSCTDIVFVCPLIISQEEEEVEEATDDAAIEVNSDTTEAEEAESTTTNDASTSEETDDATEEDSDEDESPEEEDDDDVEDEVGLDVDVGDVDGEGELIIPTKYYWGIGVVIAIVAGGYCVGRKRDGYTQITP